MKTRRGRADRGHSRKSRIQVEPGLERFEDRLLMAVFTVTSTADNTAATANDGTLRGAILASNATTTANSIVFSLPAGVQTFSPLAPLPLITDAVTIDGSTATGFNPANPVPLIQITGNNPMNTTAGPGLQANVAGVTFLDLIVDNFQGSGIVLNGGGDTVAGCYIGVDPTGSKLASNTGTGILVTSANNIIGESTTGPNVISGNSAGIQINNNGSIKNLVNHNYIGTDATGTVKLGNTFDAIDISTAGNTIGGVSATGPRGVGNLISGNYAGISISGATAGNNVIEGNYIGTNLAGTAAIPNANDGIDIASTPSTTIGSSLAGAGNVISGNGFKGISVIGVSATGNQIIGNDIGVAADGKSPMGNGDTGILFNGAGGNQVGASDFSGYSPQFGNVIDYNGLKSQSNGVEVLGAANDGILSNSIYGNGGLGIKLNGGNASIQPPTLSNVGSGPTQTRISGSYSGKPRTNYTLQFFSSPTANPSGAGDGQNYLGDFPVTTDVNGKASFTTILATSVPVGSYVSSTATEFPLVVNNTSQFSQDVVANQAALTDLAVTTAVPTTGPFLDQPYTYTLTVTNNGPDAATGVILTDTIPTQSTFQSASAGTFASGVLTDDIGPLASGASQTITIVVKPVAIASITNTATVTGDDLDPNPMNNTSTTTGTVVANADLFVILTPSVNPTPVGSPITYTLIVGNNGPSSAPGTTETVSFPADFTGIAATPDQGSASVDSSNTVTINTGILPSSSSSTIVIQATPTAVGTADATATVMSTLADPNTSNNTVTVPVTVANAADLGVQISATPDPVLVNNELLYSVVVSNNGPSAATQPTIFDQLPSGVTYVAANSTPGLSYSNGAVSGTLGPLASGASVTLTIAVIPTRSGQVTNSVTVADPNATNPAEIDPDPTNNTATTTTQVSPADLGVVVLNPADPLFIGHDAVYQVLVTNYGPATATNATLTDVLGGGATIVGASAGHVSGQKLTANLGTLANGQSTTVAITVDPTVSGTLIDSASVASDEFDPNPNNNTASSSNLVSPVDVAIQVTSSPSPVLVGNSLNYVATVTNLGPATATNVVFNDTLPAGSVLTYFLATQGSYLQTSPINVMGKVGDIAAGGTVTIKFSVTPTVLGAVANVASVASANVDTNTSNNTATSDVNVINLPGSLGFSSNVAVVPENAGSVTLVVARTNGTLGAVTADYHTSDYTAVSGVNYVGSSGTVSFAAGQSTATITIPVLDDHVINGTHGFFVTLTNPTGGASLGAQPISAVLVTNTDRDTVPPQVANLVAIPNGSSINGFIITFDKAMDPSRASLVSNYHIFLNGNPQTPVALVAASYNASNDSVTLVPSAPLPSNHFYEVVANGSTGAALIDISGNILYGSSGLGTNYVAYYGQGTNLTYDDAENNSVNIRLSGGGFLGIFRAANGDASVINLYGIVPHHSKLSGSVTKLNKKGTGHTTIGTINGFGRFGDVNSTLTTPAFYVGSAPVTAASVGVNASKKVSALSVATTPVTHKKTTPKGPAHRSK